MEFPTDARFDFGDPDTFSIAPMIIFEAGFSEKYDDLLGDSHDWLSYTRGKVRLVIPRKANQKFKKS